MAIRLEDLLASFRRHLRAAARAPRTVELYSQSVQYFSRWLTERGREPVLNELTRHAISAWLAELAETCSAPRRPASPTSTRTASGTPSPTGGWLEEDRSGT